MSNQTRITPMRVASILLGVGAAGLGCYGAYTYALKLEGGVSYLTLAAPLVAAAAALIPPIAEDVWRQRRWFKAMLWWLVLLPAAAVVFFASAERVHVAKDGAAAERSAQAQKVARAEATLSELKAEMKKARARLFRTPNSERRLAAAKLAEARVDRAEEALTTAERGARTSPTQAPEWLLPVSLDLIAFMAIWTGFSGPRPRPENKAPSTAQPRRKAAKPKKPTPPKKGTATVRKRKPSPAQLRAKGKPDLRVVQE